MDKKHFSLDDVRIISNSDVLEESALSDVIGGLSNSLSTAGCSSCNCWWGNENEKKETEKRE